MVYVEWKYFDAVAKGKVVADRKCCGEVQGMMVAKLSNWSADSMLQLHHQARQLRGLGQQSRP